MSALKQWLQLVPIAVETVKRLEKQGVTLTCPCHENDRCILLDRECCGEKQCVEYQNNEILKAGSRIENGKKMEV